MVGIFFIVRILIAATLFAAALPLHYRYILPEHIKLASFMAPYLIIGGGIVWRALRNISRGKIFDENLLMSVATIGAFILGEYPEAVAVMLFYQVGELFQSHAVGKSRRNISDLLNIRPDYANLLKNSEYVRVTPEEACVGDTVMVKPGERIPLDGFVISGSSSLDTSPLTGEVSPRDVMEGDGVISGCINLTGRLIIRVAKTYGDSAVSKILDMTKNASVKKSGSEAFISRFAGFYTPVVVFVALALAVIPPLITGQAFSVWIYRALTFLVVSCPCALVISVPLSFFGGIGCASKSGVLVKGGNYLEALAKAEIVVFDKTGTLTKGVFSVNEIAPVDMPKDKLLEYAALAEDYSIHPIAASIKRAYGKVVESSLITSVEEIAGCGVRVLTDGREILAGNNKLMKREGIAYNSINHTGATVHLAVNKVYAGYIRIEDEVKDDAKQAVADLRTAGIRNIVMLTGDNDITGRKTAKEVGIDKAFTGLLPCDKLDCLEKLMIERSQNGKLVFVGDGINDAPALARADVGVAMGGLGSDAAIEAADVVIMTDEPSKIVTVIKISKKTVRIARQNIVFALAVKGIVLVSGGVGLASMWAAVFADVGVTVIAILNAVRALSLK
ncbi:MAG: cadmium-translocating P-type ATPase [Deferribacteraceae bacterium]|jgi:Cd2+/Zn2+-exporting ATPase|nr:cadmium-translocating P-type ATPase [Deferribacteraceae bacterium]